MTNLTAAEVITVRDLDLGIEVLSESALRVPFSAATRVPFSSLNRVPFSSMKMNASAAKILLSI
jgi:hypothetical protein